VVIPVKSSAWVDVELGICLHSQRGTRCICNLRKKLLWTGFVQMKANPSLGMLSACHFWVDGSGIMAPSVGRVSQVWAEHETAACLSCWVTTRRYKEILSNHACTVWSAAF